MTLMDELILVCKASNRSEPKLEEISNLVQKLVENKEFDVLTDFDGRTPLHFLASRGNIKAIEYLLEQQIPGLDLNAKDDMGWTALSNACYISTRSMISYLLEKGAETSVVDFGGKTLLHLTAGNSSMSSEDRIFVFNALKAKGVNPDIKDSRKNIYTDIVVFYPPTDLIKDRIDPFGRTLLHWAGVSFKTYGAYYQSCEDLIDFKDDVGRTPLMYTANISPDNMDFVEWLLDKGCPVTHQDQGGKTALHFAVGYGNKELAERLIAHGAEPHVKDAMGQSAFDLAERYAPEILSILNKQNLAMVAMVARISAA